MTGNLFEKPTGGNPTNPIVLEPGVPIVGNILRAPDTNGLKLVDSSDNGIFVKEGGNVGINELNPLSVLQVKGLLEAEEELLNIYNGFDQKVLGVKSTGDGFPILEIEAFEGTLIHLDPAEESYIKSASDNGTTFYFDVRNNSGNRLIEFKKVGASPILPGHGQIKINDTSGNQKIKFDAGESTLTIKETTTPLPEADFGKIYPKADNKLYFQDGAGAEHEISLAT